MSFLTTLRRFTAGLSGFLLGAAVISFAAAPVRAQDEPVVMGMADEMIPLDPVWVAPGQYIVVLNDDITNTRGTASEMARAHGLGLYCINTNAFKDFAASVTEGCLAALERDPQITYIEQDQLGGIDVNPVASVQRIHADLVTDSGSAIVIDGITDLWVDTAVQLELPTTFKSGWSSWILPESITATVTVNF
jgi:hypothetical protein